MSKETNRSERFAQLVGLELKGNFASRNISQTKIADELGHSRSGYSKWLNAKPSIPLEALLNTCELIDADPRSVIDSAYSRLISEMGERRLVPNPSVLDSSASSASSIPDASSVPPSATDDDYISHIADLIAADPSRFALMAHTDPNKFLEYTTPHEQHTKKQSFR
ncbi:helix-turn-helix domain-containing protein [Gardnerella vaginalis]|uniref:helix-turn-helix domain-containing protein n=1 Tax=Gardnerella vaginalis TaxID=2702 RepID=UPI0039EE7D87